MSSYEVHALCRRVLHDKDFRRLASVNPEDAVAHFALDSEERRALLEGDVALLQRRGASGFLLLILSRFAVFGLTLEIYNKRMRGKETPKNNSSGEM